MLREHELEALALRLPRSERARLARRLIDSLDDGGEEVGYAWKEEAARRDEDVRLGRAAPIPVGQVLSDARGEPAGTGLHSLDSFVRGQRVILSGSVMLDRSEYVLENVPATVEKVEPFGAGFRPDADAVHAELLEHLNAVEELEGLIWWTPNIDGGSTMHVTCGPLPE